MAIPSWLYTAAFLFVLFLIFNDPSGAGATAGNFAGFVVELLGAVGEFLTGLFEGANDGGASTGAGTVDGVTVDGTTDGAGTITPDADSTETVTESFTHTHDGSTHTHTLTEN